MAYIYAVKLFFEGQKLPSMNDLYHQLKTGVDYKALPAKVSQLVLKQVEKTFKSYIEASKEYNKNPDKFTGLPKLPKYKDKIKGRNVLTYNYQAFSQKLLKQGIIKPSGTSLNIKTDLREILERKRNIGFVFQHYALFKEMTVRDNIAFGLTIRKISTTRIKERVEELLNLIHLGNQIRAKLVTHDGFSFIVLLSRAQFDQLDLKTGQDVFVQPKEAKVFA